ncbi:glycosyl transferase family 2 [Candidatus Falkowbacteria bacterium RIFCSPLOWO2_12_FULL_45_13]|uniref:Glycosyl transferase family 2 n=2 Tax=Candidatus Falkowiibacteriota TaxID=1752728 RepID=A0A1F5SEH6_9BACT|nr:MAG: glycosyl transferase family 2 [Candidatus Falkowbacteria bacterium RIFCSPLOWO2_02_FULL_45_21]OGF32084.1 MAG: glycosyl transferase family 2 [Candidatus Falkowbacteria bacterium RIFCSPLOWO2_12_FULL_45_13]
MKLSMVIPAYNEEELIGDCLNSILLEISGKNYDLEVIVVNNASTDKTREIIASFPKVRLVDEPYKGLVRARRAGFLDSSGELVANIDADTRMTEGWFDKVFEEFSKNPKLVGLSGPFIYYDLSKQARAGVRLFYYLGFIIYLFNRYIFGVGSMLQGGNFVIKRTALEAIGGFNNEFDFWGEDTDLARRLVKVGDVKFTFDLPIYASGRRLEKEGIARTGWRYALNYFSTIFFKKPYETVKQELKDKYEKTWAKIKE